MCILYIDKFDIADKCNVYHGTIKIKPIDVKISKYFNFDIENKDTDPV